MYCVQQRQLQCLVALIMYSSLFLSNLVWERDLSCTATVSMKICPWKMALQLGLHPSFLKHFILLLHRTRRAPWLSHLGNIMAHKQTITTHFILVSFGSYSIRCDVFKVVMEPLCIWKEKHMWYLTKETPTKSADLFVCHEWVDSEDN